MKPPRAPETILDEVQDLRAIIAQTKADFKAAPHRTSMKALLEQDEARLQSLLKELHLSLTLRLYHS